MLNEVMITNEKRKKGVGRWRYIKSKKIRVICAFALSEVGRSGD
jgi:hypothetical protein